MTHTIFIDGESGTTGLDVLRRLEARADLEIIALGDRRREVEARREALNGADAVILCLPDEAAKEAVAMIDNPAARVIDASTAYRVDPAWTYGFPEMASGQAEKIAASKRAANPGCYPTGFIGLVRPLVSAGIIPAGWPVTVNAVSGYSGGGRKMIEDYEAKGADAPSYLPYGLTLNHKHLPEMTLYSGLAREPIFQPSIGNFAQGMLGTVPLFTDLLARPAGAKDIHHCLASAYEDSRFVEVAPFDSIERSAAIEPRALNGTNRMRLHVFANEARGHVLLLALYDNLGKGASGAAVQNLNLMIGAEENLGTSLAA